ncbi:tetratricopeptide repeat protein [Desertifilum sp. FACHB-1129]|uniref:Uncharacterized protein n=1 Tax=Desertifilum tharense IPPAS B-1220 TaxID=1781255 RepID=A0A1E5QDN3_9CYAN|nr:MULTISPECIES: tetratricopeptide repeat protein [Desertifilum]MDA0208968.1 tetratricopeptide repeat protein [Cyanobacteria bacterium FC1]MBD2310451.1 tetratricopeptide repeat protein [Desertifilum sp. FACHB-1129]MBD2321903.1 tetratricopeptide repeat protein [Desertifilum sp. FACHB-866]MBD2332030.1 tetratricopeptide repeat protein [Desertifilum sp. FACHB-868]OEJ72772.1 hypothetical protein BH720_22600 [Desertifilum tharense IPPAS B-1220]
MDAQLPVLYLSLLLGLLGIATWFIVRQILRTRRVETTLSRLQQKLRKEKGTAQEYYELGCIYTDKKLFSQAVPPFQKALKAEDLPSEEAALIYNALGFAYAAQEQYDLAIRQYKEALKLNADYPIAYNNLGYAYEQKRLTSQALEAYEAALKVSPDNATAKKRSESLRKRLAPS